MFVYMVFFENLFIENFSFYLSKKKHNKFHKFAKCCLTFNTNGFAPISFRWPKQKLTYNLRTKYVFCALCAIQAECFHTRNLRGF